MDIGAWHLAIATFTVTRGCAMYRLCVEWVTGYNKKGRPIKQSEECTEGQYLFSTEENALAYAEKHDMAQYYNQHETPLFWADKQIVDPE
jgi:hypothetical protein